MEGQLAYNRWKALFEPIDQESWFAFLTIYTIIVGILGILLWLALGNGMGLQFFQIIGNILLRMNGAIVDQHHQGILPAGGMVGPFMCWIWLCLALNSFYKIKLFEALSTTTEPSTPTDLTSLAASGYQIVTTGYIISTMQKNPLPRPSLIEDINKHISYVSQLEDSSNLAYFYKLSKQLHFCPMLRYYQDWAKFLNISSCLSGVTWVDSNVTGKFAILDGESKAKMALKLFQIFTDKWVSRITPLENFPAWNPWLIQKTSFANLVLPVLAQWYESGLGGYWDKKDSEENPLRAIREVNSMGIFKEVGRAARLRYIYGDSHQETVVANELKVLKLASLEPLFYTLFWMLCTAFVLIIGEIGMYYLIRRIERKKEEDRKWRGKLFLRREWDSQIQPSIFLE